MPGLPLHTLTDVWFNTLRKFPHKTVLVMDGARYTYRELESDIALLAGWLDALSVGGGDHVAVATSAPIDYGSASSFLMATCCSFAMALV